MKIYEEDLLKTAEFMAGRRQWSRLYGMIDALECVEGTDELRNRIFEIMENAADGHGEEA